MNQPIQAGGSSVKLEEIVQAEPLADVSLVIVHVNEHYGSHECCEQPVKALLDSRVASHVYEHAAYRQSFLKDVVGINWRGGKRYADYELDGINYHIVDNETDPGNYHIEQLQGRRLIVVGGGIEDCHKAASEAASQQLYSSRAYKVREIHFPADCVYRTEEDGKEGDVWLESHIAFNLKALGKYVSIMQQSGRSYMVSIDRRVVAMDMSPEEPTLHLAVWTSSDKMVRYLRNHERLSLRKVG